MHRTARRHLESRQECAARPAAPVAPSGLLFRVCRRYLPVDLWKNATLDRLGKGRRTVLDRPVGPTDLAGQPFVEATELFRDAADMARLTRPY